MMWPVVHNYAREELYKETQTRKGRKSKETEGRSQMRLRAACLREVVKPPQDQGIRFWLPVLVPSLFPSRPPGTCALAPAIALT